MSNYAGFQSVKLTKPQRSDFDLSHRRRMTTRIGRLTPCFIQESVPSDTWNGGSEVLLRLAPLLAPIYDDLRLYVHFFFVPNRLLWEEWEEFITGGRLGVGIDPAEAPVPPHVKIASLASNPSLVAENSLADNLGVPDLSQLEGSLGDYGDATLDLMPFMAYQRCWYDYYRDRNFVSDDTYTFPEASGEYNFATAATFMGHRQRNFRHDYFTSALPFTQRGEEVLMPLAGSGSVSYLATSKYYDTDGTTVGLPATLIANPSGDLASGTTGSNFGGRVENIDEVNIDASSVSINDFRSAYALQVWLERNAIGGSRYTESTQAHFGVKPQDQRLQRAEYLGGGRIDVRISEVVATAFSDSGGNTVPQGNMAGHGVTYGNTNRFRYFTVEHGFIIGILSIMPEASYHQGLPRMFRRRSFLDYPWPTFAKLGEQEVAKAELYASAANLTEDENGQLPLFGYQSRYADWKYVPNTSHGAFHSSMLFWTLTRDFASSPVLGTAFNEVPSTLADRIFAVQDSGYDNFWMYINNSCHVRRPLPYFGTPNTLGF